jgi:hypothetical protein
MDSLKRSKLRKMNMRSGASLKKRHPLCDDNVSGKSACNLRLITSTIQALEFHSRYDKMKTWLLIKALLKM